MRVGRGELALVGRVRRVVFFLVALRGQGEIHDGEEREDERLDRPDEKVEELDAERHDRRDE